jgi:hypothetical protein
MRWILRRWLLAGGARSFLAGYIGCPLLIGLVVAIWGGFAKHALAESLMTLPLVLLAACVAAPFGLIVGMVVGIDPGWLRWGPWGGRLVFMALMAGLVAPVIAGRWLEKRHPVPSGGDDTPRVPAARVVTARRAYRFPTATWNRFIGPTLLVIAGTGFVCLGCVGLVSSGMLDA